MQDALTVLVTGSSSGFGELIVKTLAHDGHRVFATMRGAADRNRSAADQLSQWAAAERVQLEVVELDVTSDQSVASAVEYALGAAGTIDVVVNNAGASAAGTAGGVLARADGRLVESERARPDAGEQGGPAVDAGDRVGTHHLDHQHARPGAARSRRSVPRYQMGGRGVRRVAAPSGGAIRD